MEGRTAARPNSRAPPSTYPRVRSLGYLHKSGANHDAWIAKASPRSGGRKTPHHHPLFAPILFAMAKPDISLVYT